MPGDTFESIARRIYGDDKQSSHIERANPGVLEPLTAGIFLITPILPGAPQNVLLFSAANNENEVDILIDGQRVKFWSTVRIIRSIDLVDRVEFAAPFDADAPGFREIFQPFSYKPISITVGGIPLFTGTMVSVDPTVNELEKKILISAYSLPGVLSDCTQPESSYPLLEFNNQGLREIVDAIIAPFGINSVFRASQGPAFVHVANDPTKKVWPFIVELARQRNLVISSTQLGELLFLSAINIGNPVAILQQGSSPVLSVTPFFSPQEYYSHITGLSPVIIGLLGASYTVKNPRLLGVTRPLTFYVPDADDSEVKEAVEAKTGRMFGDIISYSVRVSTWRDSAGNLWEPNTIIQLEAKDAMIYNPYKFVVRSVEFEREERKEEAILNLVVPGSFQGKIPEKLPWEE